MTIPLEVKKILIQHRREEWNNSLWQAEKIDLPVAEKLKDGEQKKKIGAVIAACMTALAMIDEVEKGLENDT